MKQKTLLIISFAIACSFAKVPLFFTITQIDPAKGIVKAKLESDTAVYQKPKGKTTTTKEYVIPSAKSTVRLRMSDLYFQSVISDPNSFLGAQDYINLYQLTSDKSGRKLTLNADGITSSALIPLNFMPGENRYTSKISPARGLVAGEYAFVDRATTTADGNVTVWTFGIDN